MYSDIQSICRLCLATNAPVHSILDSPLKEVYEKLTNVQLNIIHKPMVACYLCYWQLMKCHKLKTRSLRADELLNNILHAGASMKHEIILNIDRTSYKLENNLSMSPMELNNIDTKPNTNKEIKVELCSIKDEIQSEETSVVNIKTEYPEVADIKNEQIYVGNIKLENEDVDEAPASDINDVGIEILPGDVLYETDQVDDVDYKIDIEEMMNEAAEGWNGELSKGSAIAVKYDIHQPTRTQDTTTTQQQNNATRETDKEEQTNHNIWKNTAVDSIKEILASTYKYRSLCNNESNDYKPTEILVSTYKHRTDACNDESNDYKLTEILASTYKHRTDACNDESNDYKLTEIFASTYKHRTDVCNDESNDYKPTEYICDTCNDTFSHKHLLIKHIEHHRRTDSKETVHKIKQYQCSACNKTFKTEKILERHISNHNIIIQCEVCGKRFKQKCHLIRHFRTHLGEKPFECKICRKKFKQTTHLDTHLKAHSGERPYACDICPKRFLQRGHLNQHLRTHSGERPFPCKICGKKFNRRSHVTLHLKTHWKKLPRIHVAM